MSGGIEELRQDVATANRIAHATGLVTAFGHVSARVPGSDRFLIPPRTSPLLARPESLLVMDCEGHVLEGEGRPNSEFWIHARIYAARADVAGVAHVHSPACVVLGQLGLPARPLHNSGAVPGDAPLFDRVGLIRTRELGDDVAGTLGERRSMLLRGHGANAVGASVREAIVIACLLEESARLQLDALAAAGGDPGRIRFFHAEEATRVAAELEGPPLERAWEYYASLV
ncbi:MAG TPA: class II aldolase/adducin family protein [Candidatus Dormibacteraeota bacterium]